MQSVKRCDIRFYIAAIKCENTDSDAVRLPAVTSNTGVYAHRATELSATAMHLRSGCPCWGNSFQILFFSFGLSIPLVF